jgi:hypothetical protein
MVAGTPGPRTKIAARAAALAAVFLLGPGLPGRARADGALPASLGIIVPADRPQQIALATTFGIILSEDGGASWLWTCEQQATTMGYLYSGGPPPRDRIYGLSPEEGLSFSDDGTCSWQRASGALDTSIASDYFVDRSNPDRVLAIAATRDDMGNIGPQMLFASADGGTTFGATPLYTAPASSYVVGVEIAKSDPNVVYIAMYGYPGRHPALVRSSDGGATWTSTSVEAGLGANETRILAVDPDDPNLLYLRVIAAGREELWVTRDGGATVTLGASVPNGSLSAFSRLASGTVLVGALTNLSGGGMTGLGFRSTDHGQTFVPWTLCPQPRIEGLAERDGVLYLAGKVYSDGFALATSTDEGATIVPLSTYDQVRGIKACPGLDCSSACQLAGSQGVWSNDVCTGALLDGGVLPPGPGPAVCPPDAGADAAAPPPGGSGCRCEAAGAGRRGGGPLVTLALVVAFAAARRRRIR